MSSRNFLMGLAGIFDFADRELMGQSNAELMRSGAKLDSQAPALGGVSLGSGPAFQNIRQALGEVDQHDIASRDFEAAVRRAQNRFDSSDPEVQRLLFEAGFTEDEIQGLGDFTFGLNSGLGFGSEQRRPDAPDIPGVFGGRGPGLSQQGNAFDFLPGGQQFGEQTEIPSELFQRPVDPRLDKDLQARITKALDPLRDLHKQRFRAFAVGGESGLRELDQHRVAGREKEIAEINKAILGITKQKASLKAQIDRAIENADDGGKSTQALLGGDLQLLQQQQRDLLERRTRLTAFDLLQRGIRNRSDDLSPDSDVQQPGVSEEAGSDFDKPDVVRENEVAVDTLLKKKGIKAEIEAAIGEVLPGGEADLEGVIDAIRGGDTRLGLVQSRALGRLRRLIEKQGGVSAVFGDSAQSADPLGFAFGRRQLNQGQVPGARDTGPQNEALVFLLRRVLGQKKR